MPKTERKKFRAKAMRRIRNFEVDTRIHEMKGSRPPGEFDEIERDFEVSKKRLINFIMETYDKIPERTEN